jgi:hypothetical protein
MREPVPTVPRADRTGRMLGRAAERKSGARGRRANTFLDQAPRGLDRVQVVSVGRKIPILGADRSQDLDDARILVRGEVVEDHDVSAAQFRSEAPTQPVDEALGGRPVPKGAHRDPAIRAHRADQRQVVAPIPWPRFDEFGPAADPGVGPAHRHIRAGFIEKHQARRIYVCRPRKEGLALGPDVRSVRFCGPRAFFLNTYPARFRPRRILDRCTRSARLTRAL